MATTALIIVLAWIALDIAVRAFPEYVYGGAGLFLFKLVAPPIRALYRLFVPYRPTFIGEAPPNGGDLVLMSGLGGTDPYSKKRGKDGKIVMKAGADNFLTVDPNKKTITVLNTEIPMEKTETILEQWKQMLEQTDGP